MKLIPTIFIALLLAPLTVLHGAELKLAAMFSDHMVLQRDLPVPIWGWTDAGMEVTVEFAGQKKIATADKTGKWSLKLDPMSASAEPSVMAISSSVGDVKRTITDILVGEVWLCSGQSNMEMPVGFVPWSGGALNYEEEIRNSANPLIRQYLVDKQFKVDQQLGGGAWSIAAADTTGSFSATGYFFAREIQKRLKVPVAIINASVGATPIEAWISRDALLADFEIAEVAARQAEDVKFGEPRRRAQYLAEHAAWREKYGRSDPAASAENPAQAAVAIDTSDWKSVTLPGSCAALGGRSGGVAWFRREIELPAGDLDALWITLPRVSDVFTAFVNGVKVHSATVETGYGRLLHAVRPPKGLLKTGKNVIAIRMQAFLRSPGFNNDTRHFCISKSHIGGEDGFPLSGEWRCQIESEYAALPRGGEPEPRQASGIGVHYHYTSTWFDRIIQPLVPFGIKGVLWYQGEHNVPRASEYGKLLRMLIQDWRTRWSEGDFPFEICQLPGNGALLEKPSEKSWPELREAQTSALALPNTRLANLIDTCEDGDLHPRNKQEVGRRLALIALAKTYGVRELAWTGPVFDSVKFENGKAILRFQHAEEGLVAQALPATYKANLRKPDGEEKPLIKPRPNSELQGFAICGEDRAWVWADAKIEGTTVIVWSDEVKQPIAVRYAWADHPVCNLYNKAGLPAFPFRTDKFPGLKEKNK
jgi:sialate O-acetylesterase